jgi:NADPH:quinone reductase-like Zn-dependent oxidoreductase
VKIRVHAAAANAADYKVREGYVQSFMKLGKASDIL